MRPFHYREGILRADEVPLDQVAARFGTPVYVYSEMAIHERYTAFSHALGPETLLCYAVKASSNLHLLSCLAHWGAGFDIVSGGELARVLRAGGDPQRIVFSGVGKSREEIAAALNAGIFCLNVESEAELERVDTIASELGCRAPVALRVNPDVEPGTHRYIATGLRESKFGIPMAQAENLYLAAERWPAIDFRGIACHIGSQLTDLAPIAEAARKVRGLYERLSKAGMAISHLDLGGGVGIRYHDEQVPTPADYAAVLHDALTGLPVRLVVELGRSIVGNAGVLLTRVEYLKDNEGKKFCIVDAAMNDLLRPSLYGAWHDILPVQEAELPAETGTLDVVGPICESGDFFARGRLLAAKAGDLLAILGAGAYGFAMASQYNSRLRPPEVLIRGNEARLIRRRETLADLLAPEENPG